MTLNGSSGSSSELKAKAAAVVFKSLMWRLYMDCGSPFRYCPCDAFKLPLWKWRHCGVNTFLTHAVSARLQQLFYIKKRRQFSVTFCSFSRFADLCFTLCELSSFCTISLQCIFMGQKWSVFKKVTMLRWLKRQEGQQREALGISAQPKKQNNSQ